MNLRNQIWEKEYKTRFNLPSSRTDFPSRALKNFIEEINPEERGSALDLGSGNGRNSIFLAAQGYKKVVGVEFAETAIANARSKIEEARLGVQVSFKLGSIGEHLNFPDDHFNLIIDMMSLPTLVKEEREIMASEVVRLLAPGGYFVFHTIAAESEAAKALIADSPGEEEGSYRYQVEDDWVTEKTLTEEEIIDLYKGLTVLKIEPKVEFTPAYGDVYERMYYVGVMQKYKS